MADYCHRLDQTAMLSYLGTDKPENVRLYERFGYAVAAEADVIGVTSWFMTREPTPPTGKSEPRSRLVQQVTTRSARGWYRSISFPTAGCHLPWNREWPVHSDRPLSRSARL